MKLSSVLHHLLTLVWIKVMVNTVSWYFEPIRVMLQEPHFLNCIFRRPQNISKFEICSFWPVLCSIVCLERMNRNHKPQDRGHKLQVSCKSPPLWLNCIFHFRWGINIMSFLRILFLWRAPETCQKLEKNAPLPFSHPSHSLSPLLFHFPST